MARSIRSRSTSGQPSNWQFRDGRPRWIPSPGLRRAGWRGCDLKGKQGWLSRGQSIDHAGEINAAVTAWRAGQPVPARFAAIAPAGAAAEGRAPRSTKDARAIGALIDAYQADEAFTKLGAKTQQDRRSKLKRFVDALCGYAALPAGHPKGWRPEIRAAYDAKVAEARSWSIDNLEPPGFGEDGKAALSLAYKALGKGAGPVMAHGALSAVSAWLKWCKDEKRAIRANWALEFSRATPDGRLQIWSWDELKTMIAGAEAAGYPSIADSLVLGVDLSWSQQNRLGLTWPQVRPDGRVRGTRPKTGAVMETPLLESLALPRLNTIRQRQAERFGPDVQPTHVLICEDTNAPWKADWYRHKFREIADSLGLQHLTDQDLRDTAVTITYEAGLTEPEIASRTGHSLKRIREILDAHYGQITRVVADNGKRKLDRYMRGKGVGL